jgi:hypothetical protein
MFANTQMGGLDLTFPDVCLTPAPPSPSPIPIPYPNVGAGPLGSPPAAKILFMCAPAHNMGTKVKPTSGDELGVNRGVASGTQMDAGRHVSAAFTVLLLGKPATRLTSATLQNSTNIPGVRIVPSQTKVLLLAP